MAVPAGFQTAADLMARTGAHTALPVTPALAGLFPLHGMERGRTYGVRGDAAASLVFALVAEATQQGAWCALVDMPHAGLRAAHEHGVALERVVCIDAESSWPTAHGRVVGALVEGFDIVVVRDPQCAPADARKIAARVKAQGAVLVVHGNLSAFPVDACLTARTQSWGFGACATERTVQVQAEGRRVPSGRTVTLLLPSSTGAAAVP
jgi:hypothetical protein